MRTLASLALTALLAAPTADAQDPDRTVAGGGTLPEGWEARTDRGTSLENVRFTTSGSDLHIVLGPRTIFYRPTDRVEGSYRVEATFAEAPGSGHSEAFGIIIGGNNLQDESQAYSYFLIRGNGQFLVKKRHGSTTSSVSGRWATHDAIKSLGGGERTRNTLMVSVEAETVRFLVNGVEVFSAPAAELDTAGFVGLRANHNLDLVVEGYTIARSG